MFCSLAKLTTAWTIVVLRCITPVHVQISLGIQFKGHLHVEGKEKYESLYWSNRGHSANFQLANTIFILWIEAFLE